VQVPLRNCHETNYKLSAVDHHQKFCCSFFWLSPGFPGYLTVWLVAVNLFALAYCWKDFGQSNIWYWLDFVVFRMATMECVEQMFWLVETEQEVEQDHAQMDRVASASMKMKKFAMWLNVQVRKQIATNIFTLSNTISFWTSIIVAEKLILRFFWIHAFWINHSYSKVVAIFIRERTWLSIHFNLKN